jgi:hypothetical protein
VRGLEDYLEYLKDPPKHGVRLDQLSDEQLHTRNERLEIRRCLLTMFPVVSERERLRWYTALRLGSLNAYHEW